MLVLTRKKQEALVVGAFDDAEPMLKITVLEIEGGKVKLGFEGDPAVRVNRLEVWQKISANSAPVGPTRGPPAAVGS